MGQVMPLSQSRERAAEAFSMRSVGHSWSSIAKRLGFKSVGAVQNAVKRHVARVGRDPVELTHRMQVEAVQMTNRVAFSRFVRAADIGDDAVAQGWHRELVRGRDQLAKLEGTYQAEKVVVDQRVTIQDATASARALAAQIDSERAALPAETILEAEVVEP